MKKGERITGVGWSCVVATSALLSPADRETVLGDLAENGSRFWQGSSEVLGFAARRQSELWQQWQPWATSVGLALPASLFLMGCSYAVSSAVMSVFREPAQLGLLWFSSFSLFLVVCWSWLVGFVVSSVSRQTLWASLTACCVPCAHCFLLWPGNRASGLQLLIFLPPALLGGWRGRRKLPLEPRCAIALASTAMFTPLMWSKGGWLYGCWLWWPATYLLVRLHGSRRESQKS